MPVLGWVWLLVSSLYLQPSASLSHRYLVALRLLKNRQRLSSF